MRLARPETRNYAICDKTAPVLGALHCGSRLCAWNTAQDGKERMALLLMKLRFPLCLFNRHAPEADNVRWRGLNRASTCRWCKADIHQDTGKRWVKSKK